MSKELERLRELENAIQKLFKSAAAESLYVVRYGRDAPALGWSVEQELVGAGFVSHAANGRSGASITAHGRSFLKSRK